MSPVNSAAEQSKILLWLKELRAQFLTAGVLPVIIGTAVAYAQTGRFSLTLCILAVCAIASIQAGANIANDYFDHISRNDWLNENETPFSGGSRMIQNKLLSPKKILIGSWIFLGIGACLGIVILAITKSLLVLALGVIGIFGGYFYTAPPFKLGYRTAGEITIAFLFGILPVYGAYYIQTGTIDFVPFLPALFAAVLIFLVIFANEFPDFEADKTVSKKTLVVTLGINKAASFYRAALISVIVLSFLLTRRAIPDGFIFYLPTFFLCIKCFKTCQSEKLSQKGYIALNRATIMLHAVGCILLVAAILLSKPV